MLISGTKIKFVVLSIALTVCSLANETAWAAPQQGRKPGGMQRFEMRQRQMEEIRANRQAEKAARQQAKAEQQAANPPPQPQPQTPPPQQVSLSSTVQQSQGNIERDFKPNKLNRLTPEERMALRKQIREARREIYLQRNQ
ncbi:hypothetical protein RF679_09705 [Undibacterium cyanobacteriorum]|uniref:Uncharacterized protein n=1 Tax=Undibacterium cyanobacteriorum TaxID=3073561 RepID=A0ABY9RE48_9BURK|nr:hypothetical protein [Undibacterium sp. 20NA77.5]WMW78939.1 hypothetical protein RF679_09705 [Undibacterium sp. 20NA77.5]